MSPERLVHDGRPVIDRTEFMRQLGISRATAERWYRNRAENGHPEPAYREGRRLYFDESTILAFGRAQLAKAQPAGRIVRAGRSLITRAQLAHLTGLTEQHLAALYSRRPENGHPEAVHRDGPWLYFDEDECLSWHQRYTDSKRATLTKADRTGDPEELVDREEAARVLGYSSKRVIDSYRSRDKGYFPEPDATEPLRWYRRTLWAFDDRRSRPGRAGHVRSQERPSPSSHT